MKELPLWIAWFFCAMEDNQGSYFIIIPWVVRSEKSISAESKLLFGEILVKTTATGYCWASNNFFANVMDCTTRSVQRYLSELETVGFIVTQIEKSNTGTERKIFVNPRSIIGMSHLGTSVQSSRSDLTVTAPDDRTVTHINKRVINKNRLEESGAKQVLPSPAHFPEEIDQIDLYTESIKQMASSIKTPSTIVQLRIPESDLPIKKESKKKFSPPSQMEVHQIFLAKTKNVWPEAQAKLEADKFFLHYEANGWVQGRGRPLKNWQAAAGQWVGRSADFSSGSSFQNRNQVQPASTRLLPAEGIGEANPEVDLQYMYDLFLEGKLKPKFIDVRCYDFLKAKKLMMAGEWMNTVYETARKERIKSLTGSNQAGELRMLEVYLATDDRSEYVKVDPEGYARTFKKVMLLAWFADKARNEIKKLF